VKQDNKIAYVLKGFPRLSETFIANEIQQLTRAGMELRLFSIKSGDKLASNDTLPTVHYLPEVESLSGVTLVKWIVRNIAAYRPDQVYWMLKQPVRYITTLAFAFTCAFQYRAASQTWLKKSFIKEFLFATHIARQIDSASGYKHIHAHFCHDATTVAWMVSKLCCLPFSFTAHAKDIYKTSLNPGNLLNRKLQATSFVITCTKTNVSHLQSLSSCPEKIHGVYHGLNLKFFTPMHTDSQDQTCKQENIPLLLSVGRHVQKKGFIYLLKACRLLRQRHVEFRLEIVGERGDQSELLENYIQQHGLDHRISLKPPVRQAQLTDYYQRAAVFVLPCVVLADGDRDGIPNVIAEAMACELPVVVTGISGIQEIVQHQKNGLIVGERSATELADAIESLLLQPDKALRIGAAARQSIEFCFDADKTHRDLKKHFDSYTKAVAMEMS
jgi:glycosyltransferase involved in cell wall biosynthesis